MNSANEQEAVKDEDAAHPIAVAWRGSLKRVVKAFADGDYALQRSSDPVVAIVSTKTADRIKRSIEAYGETLIEVPNETWNTSVSQWMRSHWEIIVDLWTAESGASDLVLTARDHEDGPGYRLEVESVHVP